MASDPEWECGEPGEEGQLQRRRGGTAVESLDPEMQLPVLDEVGAWLERELPARVGVRTGIVWRRNDRSSRRIQSPFDAFTGPVQLRDPGPGTVAPGWRTMEKRSRPTIFVRFQWPAAGERPPQR